MILFSSFLPNGKWHYGLQQMDKYADATRWAASEVNCAYVDAYGTWEPVLNNTSTIPIILVTGYMPRRLKRCGS